MNDLNDLEKIKEAVGRVEMPEFVKTFDYYLDIDSSGEPAVWVYVIVTDEEAAGKSFGPDSLRVGEMLREAIWASGVGRWPYIRFRSVSEVEVPAGS